MLVSKLSRAGLGMFRQLSRGILTPITRAGYIQRSYGLYLQPRFDQQTKTPVFGGAIFQKHHHFSTTTAYNASKRSRKKDVSRFGCKALRQFTLSKGKSAGRNSSGRITIFHRGGGAKRLQRRIDLKRSTSSMGIVERIEYDPNRSSRIALVRWIDSLQQHRQRKCNTVEEFTPPRKILEPTTTTIRGLFSFSSLPGKVDQGKVACFSPGSTATQVVVGLPTRMPPLSKSSFTSKGAGSENTCAKDVFFSAFSSPRAKGETASLSFGSTIAFPRVAVAGAKPAFFAPQMRENLGGKNTFSLSEVRKWRTHSIVWAHRIKRKAALSWRRMRSAIPAST
uniref:60S ribosomal protein L2, mitochondrial n=1 Tax=Fagus sylvatica TaxID=28930 RepID=A0A2N9HSC1_FAGSY